MSTPWLPPRSRSAETTFTDETPATVAGPELHDLPADDAAVIVLTSAAPLELAEPLPPPPYEDTPVPFVPDEVLARKDQLRAIANADLARNHAEQHGDGDLATELSLLRLRVLKLETDLANLARLVRDDMRRRAGG